MERLVGVTPVEHITTFSTGESGEMLVLMHPCVDIVIGRLGSGNETCIYIYMCVILIT